jgi:hypothetical protein
MSRVGAATLEAPATEREAEASQRDDSSRRRFTIAAMLGIGVAAIPYLWVLWDHRFEPLRTAWPGGAFSNFYEIQARALFDGHWDVPKGSLAIEAFVIDGKEYMYFGPFLSVLRMPIMVVTDRLDGQLTALSMLLSWVFTAVFSALLLWRVRLLVRGPVALGRAEAASYAVLLATITSGSVLLYLATMPWVYHEDFAWGAALGVATLFAVLGVLERPSTARVIASGALTLATILTRTTMGWGCVIAILLAALWFAVGRGGEGNRRWFVPLLVAGLVPFVIATAINLIKFGIPFGIPMGSQVFTKVNQHRRDVLAAHDGRLWSPRIVPSTSWAYLRPDGLRLTSVFPFITLPAEPARAVHGAVLDQTYRTGSMTATMPLLFLLSGWGVVTAFRPRVVGRARLVCIPLIGAAAATAGILVWGYISHRYMTEFIPVLVVASALGLVDVWRRVDGRGRRARVWAFTAVGVLGFFGVTANLLIASAPADSVAWEGHRVRSYVKLQQSISDITGHPLDDNIVRATRLPDYAPADKLVVVGDCNSLYLSTGETEHPWIPVELGETDLRVTLRGPMTSRERVPLVTLGADPYAILSVESDGRGRIRFRVDDTYPYPYLFARSSTDWMRASQDRTHRVRVVTDQELHQFAVSVDGERVSERRLLPPGPQVVHDRPVDRTGAPAPLTVQERRPPENNLCRSLTGSKAR